MLLPLLLAPLLLPQQHMELRSEGAFLVQGQYRSQNDPAPLTLPGSSTVTTSPRWKSGDQGLDWIANNIALGDSGAWLLVGKELNNECVGAYPTGSPTPLFNFSVLDAIAVRPAVASRTGTLAAMATFDVGIFSFQSTVYSWDRLHTDTPSWTATMPNTGNVIAGFLDVNTDGSRTIAAVSNTNGTTHVRVFGSNGSILSSYDFPAVSNIRHGVIDAAGERLYLGFFNGSCEIYDLNSGALLHTQILGGSFDSHAFSGDGKTFAYGNMIGLFVVRETSPGNWTQVTSHPTVANTYISQAALNHDGSRCGYTVQHFYPNYDSIDIAMWDVLSNTLMFSNNLSAPGTFYQLLAQAVDLDDAGDSIAAISWGDSMNLTPEVVVYDSTGTLTASLDTVGSAMSLAFDADGDVLAIGTKAGHANTNAFGGSVFCLDAYEQDLHVVGFPQLGNTLDFRTPAGANTFSLAITYELGANNSPFGTTEVDLGTIINRFGPHVIPTNGLSLALTIPVDTALLGRAVHAQGVRFGANAILTNKVTLNLVP